MNILGVLTEGGQTWAHRVRMLRQVIKLSAYISLIVSLIVFVALMLNLHPGLYQAPWYYLKAQAFQLFSDGISVDPVFWEKIANESYSYHSELFIDPTKVIRYTEPYIYIFLERITQFVVIALKVSFFSNLIILGFFLLEDNFRKEKDIYQAEKKFLRSGLHLDFGSQGKLLQ